MTKTPDNLVQISSYRRPEVEAVKPPMPLPERESKPLTLRQKVAAGVVGLAVFTGLGFGAKHMNEQPQFEKIEIPAEGEKVITYTATPDDMGSPGKIASHFESNRDEGRLDALTDLIQRQANMREGITDPDQRAQIQVGESFQIPDDEFDRIK